MSDGRSSGAGVVNGARKVAVVTGGGSGLGRGIARALARDHCDLVLGWTTNQDAVEAAALELSAFGGRVLLVHGDVEDRSTAIHLVEVATEELGRLDVWVNNGGVSVLPPFLETSRDDMARMMAVSFLGTVSGTRAAAGAMIGPNSHGGRIINIACDLGTVATPLLAGYRATKFAVVGLTQAAALELAPHGITVNAVCTGMELAGAPWTAAAARHGRVGANAGGRLCTPEDIGAVVVWLSSAGAGFLTGQAIGTIGPATVGGPIGCDPPST
jgi:meso-butanediol dehydrogenase/(S,S)-butanediol dehydrogenase/diacetyl reductase